MSARKKDLLPGYNLSSMISLYQQGYLYTYDEKLILQNFNNFEFADDDFDPICLKGKYWKIIKENIV